MAEKIFSIPQEIAREVVEPYLGQVDVEPPTSTSLAKAAELGIELEARCHASDDNLSHVETLGYVQDMFKKGLDSDNFAALHDAAARKSAVRRYGEDALEGEVE